MEQDTVLIAALLGVVEGLTEFIPVSSTGHLILVGYLFGFDGPPGKVFEITIQFGAILAVCILYWRRLLRVALGLTGDPVSQRFATNIIVGFIPAMVIGVLAHDFIKSVLFSPWVVCVSLIVGGFIIFAVERYRPRPTVVDVDEIRPGMAFRIGVCQTIAMIPGVSRSGATIMGALMLGVGREAATEFSFFLAIPTMLGATVYDLYKNWALLKLDDAGLIGIGFVCAFVFAMLVVKSVVGFVSRHGFTPFAYYRILVGTVMGIVLLNQ